MKAEELIDLHIHTNYSDGYSTPLSVIKTAVTKKLKRICITDHYSHYKPALNSIDELDNYYQTLTELNRKFAQIDVSILDVEISNHINCHYIGDNCHFARFLKLFQHFAAMYPIYKSAIL